MFLGSVTTSLQDEAHRELLRVLPVAGRSGCGLRGLRVFLECPVAWRFSLGWHAPAVQLAPRPDGDGAGGALRSR